MKHEKQLVTIKGKNQDISFYVRTHNKTYVFLELENYKGEKLEVKVHTGLLGTLTAILQRVILNWDGLILVTGDVGDGKSTLAQLITTIWEFFFDRKQDISQIVWTSENFTSQIDIEDNKTKSILWDESIQGGTGRDSITKQGQVLKKAFVTKRYKQHLYLLLVDEIQEYNKKIISRARAWIHVYTEGLTRGYFKVYYNKTQIRRMYRKIKFHNLELEEVMKEEYPQFKGYQPNTSDMFFDPVEYQKRKSIETSKTEEEKLTNKDKKHIDQRNNLIKELSKLGHTEKNIASICGISRVAINNVLNDKVGSNAIPI